MKKKLETLNVAIWKAALVLFFGVKRYQTYSNIVTLINVPLLVLRKIEYLQYTYIIN